MGFGWTRTASVMVVLSAQVLILAACHAHMSGETFRTLETGAFSGTGQRECQCEVLRDHIGFEEFYRELHRNRLPAPQVPEVDFHRDVILFFSLGTCPTGGYFVDVDKVIGKDGQLEVRLEITEPARDSIRALVVTKPFVMISVEKDSGIQKVRFVDQGSKLLCERLVKGRTSNV